MTVDGVLGATAANPLSAATPDPLLQKCSINFTISRLIHPEDIIRHQQSLSVLLQSCVNPDPPTSSIGFLAPLSTADADKYWRTVSSSLASDPPTLYQFIARETSATDTSDKSNIPNGGGSEPPRVLAAAQLLPIPKATHLHRSEVAKVLVLQELQGRGLGKAIMAHLERFARDELGLKILTLGTATETPARQFYHRLGWNEFGICPAYAMYAEGTLGDVSFFYKLVQ